MGGMRGFALAAAIVAAVAGVAGPVGAQESAPRARQVYDRAVALEAEGNHPAALSLLWEASGLAPRDPDVQNRLGEALERIGALDAAVDAYRRALAERPAFRKASNNLILALVKTGNGPEAIERARALVAESPKDPDRYFTLGLAQSEQDVDAAIATFRKVLELSPQHTLARYNLALVLRRADRLPEAIAELERAIATDPQPEAHYTMGVIYWHQGDLDRAAAAFRAAIAARPQYTEAYYALRRRTQGEGRPGRRSEPRYGEQSRSRRTCRRRITRWDWSSNRWAIRQEGAQSSTRRSGSAAGQNSSTKRSCPRLLAFGRCRKATCRARSPNLPARPRRLTTMPRLTTNEGLCYSALAARTKRGPPSAEPNN